MYAVLRTYTGAGVKPMFEIFDQHKAELTELLKNGVPGMVSYTMFRTAEGGASVTVCTDKAGTDASAKVAREWIVNVDQPLFGMVD